jgi:DNA repair exonuclease SbcCD ATPase subunit
MLKLISFNPTGLYSYGIHEDIPLNNQGLVFLSGANLDKGGERNSNGSGKSAIPDGIATVLFDEDNKGLKKDEVINEVLKLGCCPRLVFEAPDGKLYRATYARNWKGSQIYEEDSDVGKNGGYKGTNYYLEEFDGSNWADIRRKSSPDTQKYVEEVIGISFSRFVSTSYLAQERGLAFIRGTNADRTKILTDILDLGVWDRRVKYIREVLKDLESEITSKSGEIRGLKSALSNISVFSEIEIAEKLEELQCLKDEEKIIESSFLLKREELDRKHTELFEIEKSYVEALKSGPESIDFRSLKIQKKYEIEREMDKAVSLITAEYLPELKDIEKSLSELSGSIRAKENQLKSSDKAKSGSPCPVCGSLVSDGYLGEYRKELSNEIAVFSSEIAQLRSRKIAVDKECNAKLAQSEIFFNSRISESELEISKREKEWCKFVEEFKNKIKDLEESKLIITQKFNVVRNELSDLNKKLAFSQHSIWSLQRVLDQNEDKRKEQESLNSKISVLELSLADLRTQVSYYTWMEKNFGDRGIKSFKFSLVAEKLNKLLQEYMQVLDGSMEVWVTPYRPKKGLKEGGYTREFEIWVKDGEKGSVPVKGYSGAERGLIALAVVAALNRVAEESGTGTNLLVLDEIEFCFSDVNFAKVIDFINTFPRNEKTVIVIGHSGRLADLLDFDQYWVARKEGGITTLVRESL